MSRPGGKAWLAAQAKLAMEWLAVPLGTEVDVKRDDGTVTRTKTRSEPWLLGHGAAVIKVDGITGCYLLDRVELASTSPESGK